MAVGCGSAAAGRGFLLRNVRLGQKVRGCGVVPSSGRTSSLGQQLKALAFQHRDDVGKKSAKVVAGKFNMLDVEDVDFTWPTSTWCRQ